jgi:hypothetical protein
VTLEPADIEAIAQRVAALIEPTASAGAVRYVDAATLAQHLGVERDWVYAHARELGAIRLGGPRARLRFDIRHATRALSRPCERVHARAPARAAVRRRERHDARVELLPYES